MGPLGDLRANSKLIKGTESEQRLLPSEVQICSQSNFCATSALQRGRVVQAATLRLVVLLTC